jgi:hypothetical protein
VRVDTENRTLKGILKPHFVLVTFHERKNWISRPNPQLGYALFMVA